MQNYLVIKCLLKSLVDKTFYFWYLILFIFGEKISITAVLKNSRTSAQLEDNWLKQPSQFVLCLHLITATHSISHVWQSTYWEKSTLITSVPNGLEFWDFPRLKRIKLLQLLTVSSVPANTKQQSKSSKQLNWRICKIISLNPILVKNKQGITVQKLGIGRVIVNSGCIWKYKKDGSTVMKKLPSKSNRTV